MSLPDPVEFRPSCLEVNLDAIEHNLKFVKGRVGSAKVMAVVKANAYGHGLIPCSKHLVRSGADYLGVAFVEEGIALRSAGIDIPILVFGGIFGTQIHHFLDHDLDLTASSIDKLNAIDATAERLGRRARVHLKIDTGMARIGIHHLNADLLFGAVESAKNCDIVGVFSHFATANDEDNSFTSIQLDRFIACRDRYHELFGKGALFHIAGSGAVIRNSDSYLDMVRPGIMIYGVYPDSHLIGSAQIEPALSLGSRVVYLKVVKKGSGVGYGLTWTADKDTRVATIPIGYGDGYPRRLSNKASVLLHGKRYQVVGRICMDQIMVSLGEDSARNGDQVTLLGADGNEVIRASELAELAGTSAYEVLTSLNTRLPRRYWKQGKLIHTRDPLIS